MDSITVDGGLELYVSEDETERGSKGPFFTVYRTENLTDRWGFVCSNCETVDNAMDSMGRIVCNECGNTHKPDEWDAAHE